METLSTIMYKNMRHKITIALILLTLSSLYSQNDDGKKIEFQFKKRVSFYSVDNRYNLLKDTIYHADEGFRVYSGYDIDTSVNGKEYVIFRYSEWKRKDQKWYDKYKKKISKLDIEELPQNQQLSSDDFCQLKSMWANSLTMSSVNNRFSIDSISDLKYSDSIFYDSFNDFNFNDSLFYNSMLKENPNDSLKIVKYIAIIDSLRSEIEREKTKKPFRSEIKGINGLKLAMAKDEFEKLGDKRMVENIYSLKWKYSTKIASGFMTIPFKLRPKQDSLNFNMTTDITLGAYIGIKKRISRKGNNFIVLPVTLGLSYINVGNNETSNVNTEGNSSVVPGWTWSTGVVFDLNGFNIGFVLGQDFASGVGKDWLYNEKIWYSFSIGYSFFNKSDK